MSSLRRKRSNSSKTSSFTKKRQSTNIDFALNVGDDERRRKNKNYDEIDSGDDESLSSNDDDHESISSSLDEEEKETPAEKKVRLAREFLTKMQTAEDEDEGSSDGDEDITSSDDIDSEGDDDEIEQKDRLSRRLERERLKKHGVLERMLSKKVKESIEQKEQLLKYRGDTDDSQAQTKLWVENNLYKLCRGHDLTPTCVALHAPSGSRAYSASKDNSILLWDVETQTKLHTIVPKWNPNKCKYTRNSGEVLVMAASDDGRYLAIGGRDATVKIYDVRQKQTKNEVDNNKNDFEIRGLATTFEGHKGPVTALAFRSKSLQLFSGSDDRCIRHYNLQELTYIETLYGHQAPVTGISCYGARHEIPFSVGRDRTARAWKIAEETHLIFRGGAKLSSADCVSSIKDDWFLTGHDDGVLNLWTSSKKKAIQSVPNAHGVHQGGLPRGIVCCASIGGSDLAITGSNDGFMRLWNVSTFWSIFFFCIKVAYFSHLYHLFGFSRQKIATGDTKDDRGISAIGKIPVHGYINDIAIGPKGRFCVAAVGQEPRLGRWDRIPAAKNRFAIIPLRDNVDDNEVDGEFEENQNDYGSPVDDVSYDDGSSDDSNDSGDE